MSNNRVVGDGYSRVVVGGISQGCTASVFCLLGGIFLQNTMKGLNPLGDSSGGAGGYLSKRRLLSSLKKANREKFESEVEEDDEDPFAHDTDGSDVTTHIKAVNHIRDILKLPPFQSVNDDLENALHVYLKTPAFLDHGYADPKVSVDLGRWMASILSDGFDGCDVEGI